MKTSRIILAVTLLAAPTLYAQSSNLPPEGLISWWRAENNALDSIGTNHGVLTNGATFAAGNVGQTFALDGVNDYVKVSDSPSLRPASVTLEAWVKLFATNGIPHVFAKTLGTGTFESYVMTQRDGSFRAAISDSNGIGTILIGPTNVVTGQWYHAAFTFDDASKLESLYVNGVLVASATVNKTIGYDSHPLLLGADIENEVPSFFLNGQIDEPSIYSRALSSNEIAAIYQAGSAGKGVNTPYFVTSAQLPDAVRMVGYTQQVSAVLGTGPITFSAPSGGLPAGLNLSSNGIISGIPTVAGTNSFVLRATDSLGAFRDQQTTLRVVQPVAAPSGLISWWRAEGNALDSAAANHGTASNGVVYVAGKVGQGFGFDGVNDYVNVPDATSLRPTSITLEAWAMWNSTLGPVIARPLGAGVSDTYVIWFFNGQLNGTILDATQNGVVLSVPFAATAGRWYHVAYTFDDVTKQQALYLDGVVVASGQSLRTIGYDTHSVVLGADIENGSPGFFLNGGVDEATIYNRALSSNEIAAIYQAGGAGKDVKTPTFVTSAQLPDAVKMVGYTQQVSAVLGTGPITFLAPSGGLPSGLNLSSNGIISGIPLVAGSNSFVLRATDSLGAFRDQQTTLRVVEPVAAPSGLISWWRGEANALDSAGANHGTASNGVVYVAGKVGQGFAFDGINDYVNVPDAPSLRPTSITLEAWARFNGVQGPVFGRSQGAGIQNSYVIWQLPGNINGAIEDTNFAFDILSTPFSPVAGAWYHVAYTFDNVTKQQSLYLNGAVVASGLTFRTIGYDNHPIVIGGDVDNGTVSFLLNGGVDEATIYNRALSANEIAAIYNASSAGKSVTTPSFVTSAQLPDAVWMVGYTQQVSAVLGTGPITFSAPSGGLPSGLTLSSNGIISGIPFVPGSNSFVLRATDSLGAFRDQQTTLLVFQPVTAPSGLISWWRGEGNALDSVGANHGTASNGVVYVAGKVGQGFGFDGANDFVNVPDATSLRPTSITLEAWAKFNGTQGPVFGRSFGAALHNSYQILQVNGNLNGSVGDTNQAGDLLSVPFVPVPGRWYHVAFTFDDATKQHALYLDGAVVASGQTFRTIGYDSHPVVIGGDIDNGTVSFLLNGGVDEASIYNRALTSNEIAGIYNAGPAGKQLVGAIPQPMLLTPELIGSNVNLTWTTVPNATYRLEFIPDLSSFSNWNAVAGDVTATTNTASKLDALTPSNRFYRVRVLP